MISRTRRSTAEQVKTRLDKLSGLTKLNFDFENSGSGSKQRPGLRDLVGFIRVSHDFLRDPWHHAGPVAYPALAASAWREKTGEDLNRPAAVVSRRRARCR